MEKQEEFYHTPVLLSQSVEALNLREGGVFVDVTFGGGGHSGEILKRLKNFKNGGKLLAFDQDIDAAKNAFEDENFIFVRSNFRYLKNFLRYHGYEKVDGILADLGVSSHHFDVAERGFSFRFEGELDMRMNQAAENSAAKILNEYAEDDLAKIFKNYGELRQAGRLAQAVAQRREIQKFKTIADLLETVEPFLNKKEQKKELSCIFQALRIEVNGEIEALKEMLSQASEVLNEGGRLVVLSYHSLEDRIVKNFMKSGNFYGELQRDFYGKILAPLKPVSNKVILPSEAEIAENPRARSAKLRIAEKL